ncbi:hypothetical protein [Nocardia sp. AG03]|uniref:hypothetical protein n=1 Tax=Nocardia sp. AG03 TaxID=3025312 RepID=UPI002418AD76|nr:hypothetical protein [Nocardia sp. AG03]
MSVEHRLLGAGVQPVRRARSAGVSLGPVELITGGMLLTAAGLAMVGPLIAAALIRRNGAGAAVATMPLILLTIAVVAAISVGVTMFVAAYRRSR